MNGKLSGERLKETLGALNAHWATKPLAEVLKVHIDALTAELTAELAAANQAREAERQRADGLQTRLEAFERSPDEKQKSIWELEEAVSEAEERANENARLLHEQRQRAERAEAAEGVMREKLDLLAKATDDTLKSHPETKCCTLTKKYLDDAKKALAADPGRAANELRALKVFVEKCRRAVINPITSGTFRTCFKALSEALDELDKALSAQGEQGCGR